MEASERTRIYEETENQKKARLALRDLKKAQALIDGDTVKALSSFRPTSVILSERILRELGHLVDQATEAAELGKNKQRQLP